MTTTIRTAQVSDAETLGNLNRHVQELHVASLPNHYRSTSEGDVRAWFASMLERPTVRAWIADVEGCDVGYALTVIHEPSENLFCSARRACEIDQIAVTPAFRRKGVARTLIDRVLVYARESGIHEVELNSLAFNVAAHEAFRRLGFSPKAFRFGLELP